MTNHGSKLYNGPQRIAKYKHTRSLANATPGVATQAMQTGMEFYSGPPDPAGHTWHAFSLDTPEEEAAGIFLRRYGHNPGFVFDSRGLLLAGPVEVLP